MESGERLVLLALRQAEVLRVKIVVLDLAHLWPVHLALPCLPCTHEGLTLLQVPRSVPAHSKVTFPANSSVVVLKMFYLSFEIIPVVLDFLG